jgi:cholesterol oxidase
MKFDFDVIVIGSGFGGSVMTCRLAEKGIKVCLLERGKHYKMWDFPRRIHEIKEKANLGSERQTLWLYGNS